MKRVTNPWLLAGLILLLGAGTLLIVLHGTYLPERQELSARERFGTGVKLGVNASSTGSSTFALVEHKQWSKESLGILFQYPDNFTLTEKKDGAELVKGNIKVSVSVTCIADPAKVNDASWENNFSSPGFTSEVDDTPGAVIQTFDKNEVSLFAMSMDNGDSQGFKGLACVGGTNRKGNQAGRCFRAVTNFTAPESQGYGELRDYFLNDFLRSVGFLQGFDNVVGCPGLGD